MAATSYTAMAMLYRLVSDFAQRTPDWAEAVRHQVTPDEQLDPTLVAWRVYGSRDEFMAVIASAGLDHTHQMIPSRVLVMPTPAQLAAMKVRAGIATRASERSEAMAADPIGAR